MPAAGGLARGRERRRRGSRALGVGYRGAWCSAPIRMSISQRLAPGMRPRAVTSRRARLASATPRPAAFKHGSIGSAGVSASVPGGLLRGPAERFAGEFQVVCGLEAEPKLRRCAKPAAKTKGGYRPLSVEDFGDARDWHLQIAGDRPSGQAKRRHEFVPAEAKPGVSRRYLDPIPRG